MTGFPNCDARAAAIRSDCFTSSPAVCCAQTPVIGFRGEWSESPARFDPPVPGTATITDSGFCEFAERKA
jgi:hypothetical protein